MAFEFKTFSARLAGLLPVFRAAASRAPAPTADAGGRPQSRLIPSVPDWFARLRRVPDELELMRVAVGAAHEKNAQMETQIHALEARLKAHIAGSRAGQTLNLNTRGQVVRMALAGRQPEQIADALGVPRGEVLLLTRLQLRHLRRGVEGEKKNGPNPEKTSRFSR